MPYQDIARIRSKAQSPWLKVLTPVVLVTVCFCAVCGHVLIESRRAAWERAGDTAASMVVAIESDIIRSVETLNLSLQGVINWRIRKSATSAPSCASACCSIIRRRHDSSARSS